MSKKVPPSKKKYDEKHPVISFRVSKEEYQRMKSVLNKEKKSIGQFFRKALESEEKSYQEAFDRGYRQGFEKAKTKYAVAPLCVSCNEPIFIDDVNVQEEMIISLPFTCVHEGCPVPEGMAEKDIKRFKRENAIKKK